MIEKIPDYDYSKGEIPSLKFWLIKLNELIDVVNRLDFDIPFLQGRVDALGYLVKENKKPCDHKWMTFECSVCKHYIIHCSLCGKEKE